MTAPRSETCLAEPAQKLPNTPNKKLSTLGVLFLHPTVPENRIASHSQQFSGGTHWFPVYSHK